MSSVDLPEPDGPSSATASPRPIYKPMSRRIWPRAPPRPSDRLTPLRATASPAEEGPEMSFMCLNGQRPSSSARPRSYGWGLALLQIGAMALCGVALIAAARVQPVNAESPVKVVGVGDSLTAGYGLPDKDGFVPRLQAALTAKGIAAVVANAGVSGDTAADGLARLSWSVPEGTDAVIVELGANDMLRGLNPAVTRA